MNNNNAIPHTFIPGTKAKATEVNENFNFLKNKLDEAITSLSSTSSELETFITNTTDDIEDLNESKCDTKLKQTGYITDCIIKAPNGVLTYSGSNVTAKSGLKVLIPDGINEDGSLKSIEYTLEEDIVKDFTNTTVNGAIYIDQTGALHAYALEWEGTGAPSTFTGAYLNTVTNCMNPVSSGVVDNTKKLCRIGEIRVSSGTINSLISYAPLQLYPQKICKTRPNGAQTASRYNGSLIVENYFNGHSGYVLFSDNFIIQWGLTEMLAHNQVTTKYFLKSFHSGAYKVFTERYGETNDWTVKTYPNDNFSVTISNCASEGNYSQIMWIAIGY